MGMLKVKKLIWLDNFVHWVQSLNEGQATSKKISMAHPVLREICLNTCVFASLLTQVFMNVLGMGKITPELGCPTDGQGDAEKLHQRNGQQTKGGTAEPRHK